MRGQAKEFANAKWRFSRPYISKLFKIILKNYIFRLVQFCEAQNNSKMGTIKLFLRFDSGRLYYKKNPLKNM
jgi:hypothetical protein